MDQSPNLHLAYIMPSQAQKHVTHNEAIRALDALVHLAVLDRDLAAPPASPQDGDRYIVAAPGAGSWTGQAGRIAAYQDGAWAVLEPRTGWRAWIGDEGLLVVWNGSSWVSVLASEAALQGLPLIGINTNADTMNRIAAASPATLLTHVGAGHQLKINKAASPHTASQLFQVGFSGRAEVGLAGDDNLRVKVSSDGADWREAIVVDRTNGRVAFPCGGPVETRSSDVILDVPSAYPTIQAALDALAGYRFTGAATGTVRLAAGTYALAAPLRNSHPQPGRVVLAGPAPVVPLSQANVSASQPSTVATVRSRYGAVIDCQGCSGFIGAGGEGLTIRDLALIQVGSGTTVGAEVLQNGELTLTRACLVGFTYGLRAQLGARVTLDAGSAVLHNTQDGCSIVSGASLETKGAGQLVMRNGAMGINASRGAVVDFSNAALVSNGHSGLFLEGHCSAKANFADVQLNSAYGVYVTYNSTAVLQLSTIGNNTSYAVYAYIGSIVLANTLTVAGSGTQRTLLATTVSALASAGTHVGTPVFSPAIGSSGNNGSYTTT